MSAPTLSVVMPVYNVGAYLPCCLDSLMAQTRPPDEIIAVDDGSTDDCPQILAAYAARMPNLTVIRQDNGGLSAARNTGMAAATGDYLAFLDSDDFLEPDAYATLLAAAVADDLDLVLCNARYHFEGRQPDSPIYQGLADSPPRPGREWLRERLAAGRFLHMVWLHLYRRSFLAEHHFRFPVGIIHEDVVWSTRALLLAPRVRYVDRCLVNYRIPLRRFTPAQNRARLERVAASSVYNARNLAALNDTIAPDPALRRLLDWQLVDGGFSVFHKIERIDDAHQRRRLYATLRREGFYRFLLGHAVSVRQMRRVIGHYLRGWYR